MLRSHLAPLAVALVLGTGLAGASAAAEEKSCVDQIEALCGDTEANSPERRTCVKDKRSQLSAECQKRLGPPGAAPVPAPSAGAAGSPQQMQRFFETCRPDQAAIAKLCSGDRAQGDALLQCIVENESKVSKACAEIAKASRKGGSEAVPK